MSRGFSEAGAARISTDHVYQATRLSQHVMEKLPSIKAPALVVHAIDDETASPKNADYIMKHLGSPVKRRVMLGNSYHMVTMDNERDAVAAEVNHFFQANIHAIAHTLPARIVSDKRQSA